MSTVRNFSKESLKVISANKGLQIRDGLDNEYPDVYTDEVVDALKRGTLTEAFGAGTAATLAPICTIAYEGKDYDLKDPDTWTVSPTLLNRLTEIRLGEYPDENNWLVRL